jgi:hypothetical protein
MHSRAPQYYQTRNLAVATWQEIFYQASHIPDLDEFTTDARAYNTLPCTLESDTDTPHAIPWGLTNALRTRLNIVLVCKAWKIMGLEVLYSHIRVFESFLRKIEFYKLLMDNPQLLLHTRRLTIDPGPQRRIFYSADWEPPHRASWLASSLPRLQILEAPWQLLSLFPLVNLPPGLEVAIFRNSWSLRMEILDTPKPLFPTAWRHVRVLSFLIVHLAHCATTRPSTVLFTLLEDLQVSETPSRDNEKNLGVIRYISTYWTAPKLNTLSIGDITWTGWAPFLQRHAGSLKVLALPTYHPLEKYETWKSTNDTSKLIQFPKLRELYLPYGKDIPYVVAKQLKRVGVHIVGCSGPDSNANRPVHLNGLLEVFRFWQRYPKATTYCIHGWHGDTLWLEEQPEVVRYIQKIEQGGIKVEWVHLGQDAGEPMKVD